MKLTEKDLLLMHHYATQFWVELPGDARLEGAHKRMTPEQRQAASWVHAALIHFNSLGLLKTGLIIDSPLEFEYPDSLPVTEGFERAAFIEEDE